MDNLLYMKQFALPVGVWPAIMYATKCTPQKIIRWKPKNCPPSEIQHKLSSVVLPLETPVRNSACISNYIPTNIMGCGSLWCCESWNAIKVSHWKSTNLKFWYCRTIMSRIWYIFCLKSVLECNSNIRFISWFGLFHLFLRQKTWVLLNVEPNCFFNGNATFHAQI